MMDPPRKTGREADWTRTHAQKITEAQESMRLVSLVAPAAVGCSPSPHLLVSGAPAGTCWITKRKNRPFCMCPIFSKINLQWHYHSSISPSEIILDQLLKSWPFDPSHLVFRTSGVHDLALISQSSTSRNWKKNHSCQGRKAGWSTTLRARCSLEYIPAGRQHSPGRRPLWSLPCEILGKNVTSCFCWVFVKSNLEPQV